MKVVSCDCCGRKTALCGCEPDDVPQHYPGCHKVHLECANKKIEEIRSFLKGHYWDCYCDTDGYDPQCGQHGDGAKWIESLGEE